MTRSCAGSAAFWLHCSLWGSRLLSRTSVSGVLSTSNLSRSARQCKQAYAATSLSYGSTQYVYADHLVPLRGHSTECFILLAQNT